MKERTLGNALRSSSAAHSSKTALMVREGDGFRNITYGDLLATACQVANALSHAGVQPGDRIAIFSENCPEWAFVDWGAQLAGVVTVPIYPTLTPPQVGYILRDSGAKMVFVGDHKLRDVCLAAMENPPPMVVLESDHPVSPVPKGGKETVGTQGVDAGERVPPSESDLQSFLEGQPRDFTSPPIAQDDLATIIYTSGTTGDPKGVMLTHGNFIADMEMALPLFTVNEHDLFLSFLPLSHVYERMAGHFLPIYLGATIAYAKSLRTLSNDILLARPTVMLCVPRFLQQVQDRIYNAATAKPGLQKTLFLWALAVGKRHGLLRPLAHLLVGRKVRARFGGRLRLLFAGGAALPNDTAEFFDAFGLTILQGYGLTETSPVISINPATGNRMGTVGRVIPGVEVKIADDGEILSRGPHIMKGYYHLPEATGEAIDSEGWFHTGDIGELSEDGYLRITDRKKDLLVLANGKNVAPQPVENLLKTSPLIEEAVLFGDGQSVVSALIVPRLDALGGGDPHKAIKAEVDRLCKSIAEYERVKKFALLDAAFSVETGELTPTLKVRRKVVKEKYADALRELGGE